MSVHLCVRLSCGTTLCPAAQQVQDDIIKQLRIPHAVKLVSSFNRPNIHYSVRFVTDAQPEPLPHIVALLKEGRRAAADGAWPCSIIYALKKGSTEEIAAGLTKKGVFSTAVLPDLSKRAMNEADNALLLNEWF